MPIDPAHAKSLFFSALDQPAPQRAAYLDAACTDDPALRQRVEAMLQAHEGSGELLERGPAEMLADETQAGMPRSAASDDELLAFLGPPVRTDSIGRLGHYHVQEIVGKGGFGIVLKAFDEKLHRVVAIKVLAPELAVSATARTRFVREARAAAAVTHEHVVAIHAIEEDHRPPYIVMQFVDGVSLQEKLDQKGALSLREILRIGAQTACGLAAAHKQGLVHRDVKPANILLENGVERVKITDFGLARTANDASVTQSGTIAGTPMYMSPEQANGAPLDHRSDLFSLGTVLYVMATGRLPFRAGSTMAVLKRVCDDTPTPVQQVNADVPDWLAAIIAKLHAKQPVTRFQSAREVTELLDHHLAQLQAGHGGRAGDRSGERLEHVSDPAITPPPDRATWPGLSDTDVRRIEAVLVPTLRPGLSCLYQSILIGTAIGAAVGLGLGITEPELIGMVDPPAWLGEDNLVLVNLLQGAALGAFFGTLVGLVRWVLRVRLSWEIRNGLRCPVDQTRDPRPTMTPAGRLACLGLLIPIVAGIVLVALILLIPAGSSRKSAVQPKDPVARFVPVFGGPDWRLLYGADHTDGWKGFGNSNSGRGEYLLFAGASGDTVDTMPRNFHLRMEVFIWGGPNKDARGMGTLRFHARPRVGQSLPKDGWFLNFTENPTEPGIVDGELLARDPARPNTIPAVTTADMARTREWFYVEVVARDQKTEVLVNGNSVMTLEHKDFAPTAGVISLWNNGRKDSQVAFRNIEIKELR